MTDYGPAFRASYDHSAAQARQRNRRRIGGAFTNALAMRDIAGMDNAANLAMSWGDPDYYDWLSRYADMRAAGFRGDEALKRQTNALAGARPTTPPPTAPALPSPNGQSWTFQQDGQPHTFVENFFTPGSPGGPGFTGAPPTAPAPAAPQTPPTAPQTPPAAPQTPSAAAPKDGLLGGPMAKPAIAPDDAGGDDLRTQQQQVIDGLFRERQQQNGGGDAPGGIDVEGVHDAFSMLESDAARAEAAAHENPSAITGSASGGGGGGADTVDGMGGPEISAEQDPNSPITDGGFDIENVVSQAYPEQTQQMARYAAIRDELLSRGRFEEAANMEEQIGNSRQVRAALFERRLAFSHALVGTLRRLPENQRMQAAMTILRSTPYAEDENGRPLLADDVIPMLTQFGRDGIQDSELDQFDAAITQYRTATSGTNGAMPRSSGGQSSSQLSLEAADALAERVINGDPNALNNLRGPALVQVHNRVAERLEASGDHAGAITARRAASAAASRALGQLETTRAMVIAAERAVEPLLDRILDLSARVPATSIPIVNEAISNFRRRVAPNWRPGVSEQQINAASQQARAEVERGLQQRLGGTASAAEVIEYSSLIMEAMSEYGKVLSGAYGAGGVSDSQIEHAMEMLNDAQTPEQVRGAINAMRRAMHARENGYTTQRSVLLGQLENAGQEVEQAPYQQEGESTGGGGGAGGSLPDRISLGSNPRAFITQRVLRDIEAVQGGRMTPASFRNLYGVSPQEAYGAIAFAASNPGSSGGGTSGRGNGGGANSYDNPTHVTSVEEAQRLPPNTYYTRPGDNRVYRTPAR